MSETSLSEVQEAFSQWRSSGRTRQVPEHLRAQAVELLSTHKISQIQKALGLSHQMLSRWRQSCVPKRPPTMPPKQ